MSIAVLRSEFAPAEFNQTKINFVWAFAAIFLLILGWERVYNFGLHDPDDYMRLLQVRDWLAGQGWYDTTQYRLDPPAGADMHWLRIVDIALAVPIAVLDLILPQRVAETIVLALMPLAQLWVAMHLIAAIMRRLRCGKPTILAAIVMLPFFPLLLANFLPMRIDHHGWQALCALAATYCIVSGGGRTLALGGIIAAVWLGISLEGLPLVAAMAGFLALHHWAYGSREHVPFLSGLAVGTAAISIGFRPPAEFLTAYCDVLSGPHVMAFGLAGSAAALGSSLPGQNTPAGRLLGMVPIALLAAASIFLPLGQCAIKPLANVDPIANAAYFDLFMEASPITTQTLSASVMLLMTLGLATIGGTMAVRDAATPRARRGWAAMATIAVSAGLVSLLVMRGGIIAQVMTVPFCALLMVRFMPRARAISGAGLRILATILVLALTMPILPSAVATPFNGERIFERQAEPFMTSDEDCKYEQLAALPTGLMFTPIGYAPEILVNTRHSGITSTYHRNDDDIVAVYNAFSGPIDQAREIIKGYGADYVTICASYIETPYLAAQQEGNLARRLMRGQHPEWLRPVSGFTEGPLLVWEVVD